MGSVAAAWAEVGPATRVTACVLVGCAIAVLAHQQLFYGWWIEDAAISFAYARNLVDGHGLVPWPGGERIEGYSNPTWVALLAAAYAVGVEGFTASKVFGTLFAILALWPTWQLARRAVHPDDRPADLLAPVLLAASAQFAIWSASGLENGLFGFLLIGGAARLVAEVESPRRPLSALWFLALAWTRPEGVIYGVVAFVWHAFAMVRDRRGWQAVVAWGALFAIPEIALLALRLAWFAWPLPNTYYAKLDEDPGALWRWTERGWQQLRAYCAWGPSGDLAGGPGLAQGIFIPVYLAGAIGLRGWRRWLWLLVLAAVLGSLAFPGPDWLRNARLWIAHYPSSPWVVARIAFFYVVLVGLPLAALGAGGFGLRSLGETRQLTRGLVFHLFGAGVVFSVYSTGDWMRGYRWMSLIAPPAAVLLAVGTAEIARQAERLASGAGLPGVRRGLGMAGTLIASVFLGAQIAVNLVHSFAFYRDPEWPPSLVKLRVDYTQRLADLVFYDEPLVPLDMDMGAHLWFSRQRPIDMARLVDIPMAQHRYSQRAFIEEYVFEENHPDFAHVHAAWSRESGLTTYDEWADYFQVPGYPDRNERGGIHHGVWMRRSLFMEARWTGTAGRSIGLAQGIRVEGWEIPSPEVAVQGRLYFELGLSLDDPVDRLTTLVFLRGDGGTASWVLPPGHGLLAPGRWKRHEVHHGRWSVPLGTLPPGTYELGLVILDREGSVVAPEDPGLAASDPAFARGEIRFPQRVVLVEPAVAESFAQADVTDALDAARSVQCVSAEASWTLAKRHFPTRKAWARDNEPATELADCWARLSTTLRGAERVAALARAHRWDHESAVFLEVSEAAGERLWLAGLSARDRGDWEAAYAAFRDLLRFQPWRAWARRYAEEARDHRLGYDR